MTKTTIITTIFLSSILLGVAFTSINIQPVTQAFADATITPSCGATIGPGEFELGADVGSAAVPCTGNGLILAADTELELNGFTIFGTATIGFFSPTTGVQMNGDSRVRGPGTITGFNTGVAMGTSCAMTANDNEVRNVTLIGDTISPRTDDPRPAGTAFLGNGVAIWGNENKVRESTIEHFPEFGVNVFCGNDNEIEENSILFNNGPPSCGGVRLNDDNNRVRDNTISKNGDFGVFSITFAAGAGGNEIKGNTIDNNAFNSPAFGFPSFGILIQGGSGHEVRENQITNHHQPGIQLFVATDSRIRDNVSDNNQFGINLGFGATNNEIEENTALNNSVFDLFDGIANCDANIWDDNTFNTANQACIM